MSISKSDKDCPLCKETKEVSHFYKRDCGTYIRYSQYCKECTKKKKNHSYSSIQKKMYDLQRIYGLSFDRYLNMYVHQEGKCAVCRTDVKFYSEDKSKAACVDHCHVTGRVRGILCHTCNRAIGLLQDDVSILLQAVEYLSNA